ncbi:helix-turn-helix transcriptional regulator [Streptomyces radicis]|uniref:helix-turn-helix transcriptional regulator n=1 Tax=Streptomyces radicis TaxID=1750517 RepID=UPI0016024EAE|nr:LuxR family transcriptional regulator [Streptomyces radicis]
MERRTQLSYLRAMVRACRNGSGGLVLVEGTFGTGKTSLLKAVREQAVSEGFTTLQACGDQLESTFRHGVVRQLFEQWLARVGTDRRDAALSGPAASAAPLFGYGDEGPAHETEAAQEEAIVDGLCHLLVNVSEGKPLLVLLDDLQWVDAPSLRFLESLRGRLGPYRILVCAAAVPSHRGGESGVARALLDPHAPNRVHIGALSRDGVREYVSAALSVPLNAESVLACYEATAGNPFFLNELVDELRARPGADGVDRPDLIARIGPRTISRVVQGWIEHISGPGARGALALARTLAVFGSSGDLPQLAETAELTLAEATEAAEALVDAGLVEPDAPLRYIAPIVRNAVYEHLPQTFRYRAHYSAAQTLIAGGAPAEQVADHLLHTPPSKDSRVGETLIAAGRRSLLNGDFPLAATLYRRALLETVSDDARCSLLAGLGEAELRTGDPRATQHLRDALDLADDPAERASIALNLSGALTAHARYEEAMGVLNAAHREVGERPGSLVPRLRSEMTKLSQILPPAQEAFTRLEGQGPASRSGERARRALAALITGATAAHVLRLCDEALLAGVSVTDEHDGGEAAWCVAMCLLCCGRITEAGSILDNAIHEAEVLRSSQASDDLRALRAYVNLNRGMLSEADTDATATLERTTGDLGRLSVGRPFAILALIDLLVLRNQVDTAAEAYQRHAASLDMPRRTLFLPLMVARGRLFVAQGDTEAGVADFLRTRELLDEWGARCCALNPAPRAVHGLADLGRFDEARSMGAAHLATARAFGADHITGVALGAYARTLPAAQAIEALEEAVSMLAAAGTPGLEANELVRLGTRLRDAGYATQARRRFRAADEIADGIGALATSREARRKLASLGVRVRETPRAGMPGLTPREMRVSVLAADGKRNREIANILFVTVKTVEWHLSQVYRKLGIASRDQLPEALARC